MSYILGFFAADGTMIKNNRGAHFIEFHITDKKLLFDIRKALQSNHVISIRIKQPQYKVGYRLQIGSKEMFNDLRMLGFSPRKSKNLSLPIIPDIFIGDFIRGYFDGDGCVYFKKHHVKDRKNKKWIFATRFTCGCKSFFISLLKLLHTHGLKKGFIVAKWRNSGYELVFSHHDSVALFRLMYNTVPDNGLYLARKYKMYLRAVTTLYGSMRW